jgi:aryl-alcohol dehydrogenase-like predicted oxidoreductase
VLCFRYAGGKSESILGRNEACRKALLASKVNPWSDNGLKYDHVINIGEASLREYVVVYFLH